ncbi:MAG: tetratricopeptide repeat protein [Ignavibacteria bacterium]|jgi:tetratricopeptide (TPR) repeat protein
MDSKNNISRAAEIFNKAYNLHLEGNIDSAIFYYKKSIKNHPTAKAHTYLGWALSLQGQFEEAIEECKTAIDLNPDYGNPYNDIGSYLMNLNRDDEAITWFEKALEASDYGPRYYPYYNLGKIYEKRGDWFLAIDYYDNALKINPDYDSAKSAFLRLVSMMN